MSSETTETSKKLYDAFNKVVFLNPQRIKSEKVYSSPKLMRQALFNGMYEGAPRVLEHFRIDVGKLGKQLSRIKNPVSKLVFLADYTSVNFPPAHKFKVLDSPKTNVETNTLACTMATLLGAYLLDQLGFEDNFHIRPANHSVNGVKVKDSEYFVDFGGGVVRKIKRLGDIKDNIGDEAELVEIINPFGSELYRLAISCDRSNLSLSVIGNFHELLRERSRGSFEVKGDEDEETRRMKMYFSALAKPFDGWNLRAFSKYRGFLSPGLSALESKKEMEKERKRVRVELEYERAGEKVLSPELISILVKRMAANLEVQGIDPTGKKIVQKIKSDPRYIKYRKDPRMRKLLTRLKEKGGLDAIISGEK